MKFQFNNNSITINDYLAHKIDIMALRVTEYKFDNVLIIDGAEGFGKSNLGCIICAYTSFKTGRTFNNSNIFFQLEDMLKFATETKEQIIMWDEAALAGLASESYSKVQNKLLKLLMVARKKNHFYVFIIPKFYKLREGIVERAMGLVHVYSHDELTRGRFTYYKNKNKEALYNLWKYKKKKEYRKFYSGIGTFSSFLPKIISEDTYEAHKDKAILSIGERTEVGSPEVMKLKAELIKIKKLFAMRQDKKQIDLAKEAGVARQTLHAWKNAKEITINVASGSQSLNNYVEDEQEMMEPSK